MITNVSINHEFKLGDKVWIKAQIDKHKKCNSCKQNSGYHSTNKVVSGKVVKIRFNTALTSSPNSAGGVVTYDILIGKTIPAAATNYQCFSTEGKAKKSKSPVIVYGL